MEAKNIKAGRTIRVMWEDSAVAPGWQSSVERAAVQRIATVGYVVKCDVKAVTISSSVGDNGSVLDPLSIPWSCITKLRIIDDEEADNEDEQ